MCPPRDALAEDRVDDTVPQQPLPVSPAMAAKLVKLGMWDMQGWLCGPQSLRSLGAVARLLVPELKQICDDAIAARFTVGHVATLRALHAEAVEFVNSSALSLAAQEDLMTQAEQKLAVVPVNGDRLPAATRSEEAGSYLDDALQAFEFWCCNISGDEAAKPLARLLNQTVITCLKSAQAQHLDSRLAMSEPSASERASSLVAGALDNVDAALQEWRRALACPEGAGDGEDAKRVAECYEMQTTTLDVALTCCYEAMEMAKRATQDALLYCCCEGMDAKAHANTKLAKDIVQTKCNRAFGRNISGDLLSRLQNARHQLFVREQGAAKPQLINVSLPSPCSDHLGLQTADERHCLRIQSIQHGSIIGQWNAQHQGLQVSVGDRVVRVCGRWGEAPALRAAMHAESTERPESITLNLLVLRSSRPIKKKSGRRAGGASSAADVSVPIEVVPLADFASAVAPIPSMPGFAQDCSNDDPLAHRAASPSNLPPYVKVKNTFIDIEEGKSEVFAAASRRVQSCPGTKSAREHVSEVRKVLESGVVVSDALSNILVELESALRIDWSDTDELADASHEVVLARSTLETVAELGRDKVPAEWRDGLVSLEAWVRAETDEHFGQVKQLPMRLKLIGLLFGAGTVLELLRGYIQNLDEDYVTSALRVLAELRQLRLLEAAVSHAVVKAVIDDNFKPQKKHCHSACAGILGELLSGDTLDVVVLNRSIGIILETAEYWLNQYVQKTACLHECFWALNNICAGADASATRLPKQCDDIADKVLNNKFFLYYDSERYSDHEEHKLLLEARKLKAFVSVRSEC